MNTFFTTQRSARAATAITALLLALLLWVVVRLIWQLVDGPSVATASMPLVPRIHHSTNSTYEQRWELFGRDRRAPLVVPETVATSPLAWRLRGVVASGDNSGYAVIADESGREAVYRPGDRLTADTALEAVEARRVLLRRGGQIEALELPRAGRAAATDREPRSLRPSPDAAALVPGIRGLNADHLAQAAAGFGLGSDNLAGAINILPVAGGGFRVRPGRDATIFRQLGLQVDDVITAVNGQTVQSEQDARRIFDDVMRSGEIAITVQRQGREQVLRPDLRGL